MMGYEQSYVSALELGTKGPTNKEFVAQLIKVFTLDTHEQAELIHAIKQSQNRFTLPAGVQVDTFRMCSELWEKIDQLPSSHIQAIRALIKLNVQEVELTSRAVSQAEKRLGAQM
jgi:hypothetical protein